MSNPAPHRCLPVLLTTVRLLIAFSALLAGSGNAIAKERELMEIQTPGYRIISSYGKDKALQYLQQLERFRQTLEVSLSRPTQASAIETRLYVLSSSDWKEFFRPRQDVAGFFAPDEFVNYLVVDGGEDRGRALQTTYHEYAHYFLSTQFPGSNHPAWFHEGFAQAVGTVTFDKSHATFALPVDRILQLRDSQWIPFESVLAVDRHSPQYSESDMAPSFYAQSWALVHYAMNGEPAAWGKLRKYLLAVDKGQPIATALQGNFGMNFVELDKLMQEYVNRKSLPTMVIDLPPQPPPQILSVRKVDADEGAVLLAEAALRLAFQKKDKNAVRVQPLLERIAPGSALYARTLGLRGLMAGTVADDAQTDAWIGQAAQAMQTTDAATAKILGTVLLHRFLWRMSGKTPPAQRQEWLERGRGYYQTALLAQPDDLETIWGFGMTSVLANIEVEKAVELLKSAHTREPRSEYLAVAMAYGHETLGQTEAARRYWTQAEMYARHAGVLGMARKALAAYDNRW